MKLFFTFFAILLFFSSNSQTTELSEDKIRDYIKELDVVISTQPTAFDYYLRGVQKSLLKEYDDAIDDLDASLEFDNSKKETYFYRGLCEENLKLYKKALADYDKSLELGPNYEDALSRRAYCKSIMKDYEGAIKDYTILLTNSKTEKNFNNRGLAYAKMNDNAKAILDFNKAIELNQKNVEAIENRAFAKAMMGDKTALNDFNKVIELCPKNGKAYFNRAVHYLNYKIKADYCLDLKKSIELGFKEAEKISNEVCK